MSNKLTITEMEKMRDSMFASDDLMPVNNRLNELEVVVATLLDHLIELKKDERRAEQAMKRDADDIGFG